MNEHAYPSELADYVSARWRELDRAEGAQTVLGGALPSPSELTLLLSVAYQATLLREEERPVSFRLVLGDPDAFPADAGPPEGLHRLVLDGARPFTEHELRRLSPAAKYHRALIGVRHAEEGGFVIWGLLHSGPRWLQGANGGRGVRAPVTTEALVVRATGPGRIAVARGDALVAELRGGTLSGKTMDVFASEWLGDRFTESRLEFEREHELARVRSGERWGPIDPRLARRLSQEMVKRMIATIRSAHHGGTVVLLPSADVDEVCADPSLLRVKYPFSSGEPRRRYRSLILRALAAVAKTGGATWREEPLGWDFYESAAGPELAAVEEAMFEMSHLIAGLADVDGAVVMTTRFEVLGFGAEIGGLPEVRAVHRSLDLEGTMVLEEGADGVGTRHRSAFRLCQRFRRAVVIVVSQDGHVRFVAWHGDAVTYWDHASAGWIDTLRRRSVAPETWPRRRARLACRPWPASFRPCSSARRSWSLRSAAARPPTLPRTPTSVPCSPAGSPARPGRAAPPARGVARAQPASARAPAAAAARSSTGALPGRRARAGAASRRNVRRRRARA